MKKYKKRTFVLCVLAILIFGGCAGTVGSGGKGSESVNHEHVYDDGGHAHLGKTEAGGWEDNDGDELRAVIDHSVEIVSADGQLDGGKSRIFVCEGGCMLFKNHLFDDYENNWSGISGVTAQGERMSLRVCVEPELKQTQVHEIGSVSGGKGYVACRYAFRDGKPDEYWFYELDESFQRIRGVQARLDGNDLLEYVMGDAEGFFHAVFWREDDRHAYVIVSPEGEKVFETDLGKGPGEIRLSAFGVGRVAVCDVTLEGDDQYKQSFYEADLKEKTLRELPFGKEEAVREKLRQAMFAAMPVDDNIIAWCDLTGICFYDLRERQTRIAYEWTKHEIEPYAVYDFAVNRDGSVGLAYADPHGLFYLLLKPTE